MFSRITFWYQSGVLLYEPSFSKYMPRIYIKQFQVKGNLAFMQWIILTVLQVAYILGFIIGLYEYHTFTDLLM